MKKHIYLKLLFCTIICLLSIYSCRKPDDFVALDQVSAEFDMTEVIDSYKKEMSDLPKLRSATDKAARTNFRKMRWDEAYTVFTEDGNKMIVPFSLEEELFLKNKSDSVISYGASTFFIVSNKNGKYEYETATYISEDTDSPSQITKEWSGRIIIETARGEFKKTLLIKNGKIIEEGVKSLNNGRVNTPACYYIVWWSCAYIPDMGYSAPCIFMHDEELCYEVYLPSGGGGVGGGYGNNGQYFTVSGIEYEPDGNPYSTVDRLTQLIRWSNMTSSEKAGLNEVLEELVTYTCIGKTLYAQIAATNVKFNMYMDPTIGSPASYSPSTRTIRFKSASAINLVSFSEELFHAYQDLVAYPGGTSQYLPIGRPNIEFEAKVWRDMMSLNSPVDLGVTTVQTDESDAYYLWLVGLTNGGTEYPDSFVPMSSMYYHYLNEFLESYPAYNDPVIPTMTPDALLQLVNVSPCPK